MSESLNSKSLQLRFQWLVQLVIGVLGLSIVLVLIVTIGSGIVGVLTGNLDVATDYANFASGAATILLVGFTVWYTFETRRMAGQMEKQLNWEHRKRHKELRSIRLGLKHEIDMAPEYEVLASIDMPEAQHTREIAPATIFQKNSDKIGRLSEDEIDAVMRYYHRLSEFNDFLDAFRRGEARSHSGDEAEPLIEAQREAIEALDDRLESPSDVD